MPDTMEVCGDVPKLRLTAEMLRCGRMVQFKAWGTSMLPSLWPGDLLTIQSVAHDEIVRGDMVLVMRDNRFRVHRLVEKPQVEGHILWITKGDAVPRNDPPVAASELLGRVAGVRRGNRSFVPTRRLSMLHSALAWTLCRWDHFRSLALRIHAARLQASPTRAGQFFRGVFAEASTNRSRALSNAGHE
jgi:Peptidase S24-like